MGAPVNRGSRVGKAIRSRFVRPAYDSPKAKTVDLARGQPGLPQDFGGMLAHGGRLQAKPEVVAADLKRQARNAR